MISANEARNISNENNQNAAQDQLGRLSAAIEAMANTGATFLNWNEEFYLDNENTIRNAGYALQQLTNIIPVTDKIGNTVYKYTDTNEIEHVIVGCACEDEIVYGYVTKEETTTTETIDGETVTSTVTSYDFTKVELTDPAVSPIYTNEYIGWRIEWT